MWLQWNARNVKNALMYHHTSAEFQLDPCSSTVLRPLVRTSWDPLLTKSVVLIKSDLETQSGVLNYRVHVLPAD